MVVASGRSPPSPELLAEIAELTSQGCRVEVITGDIADPQSARRLVAAVEDAGFSLAGVVHSAMVLADEIVLQHVRVGRDAGVHPKGQRRLVAAPGHRRRRPRPAG